MLKDKKGAELSMNVIVISIIVIVVLVVVISVFLGFIGNFREGLKGATPDELDLAIQDCQSKCQFAQSFEGDTLKAASSYCKKTIPFDDDGDELADFKAHCYDSNIGIDCPGISDQNLCGESREEL